MVYVTVKQSPRYRQMTMEEFIFGDAEPVLISGNQSCTRTYTVEYVNSKLRRTVDIHKMIQSLHEFNMLTEEFRVENKSQFYREFFIPKKSKGFRRISAPNPDILMHQRTLKRMLEDEFHVLYHTSAFAYIKKRCTLDAIKRHQMNESRWFAKYDFSNFFGSTTKDFVMRMFSMIFPFSEIVKTDMGRKELSDALEIAFLDGVLPQGTPLSPIITNVMMIPVDHALSNRFRDFDKSRFIYTRYADDILVSSRYDFDFRKVEAEINTVLESFDAPFLIKNEKTRYGSSAGSNWNLGVMLNKDNKITIGIARKRQFKAAITNYTLDRKNGIRWDKEDVMVLEGQRNYYHMVEPESIDEIVKHIGDKFGTDVRKMIKEDLRS